VLPAPERLPDCPKGSRALEIVERGSPHETVARIPCDYRRTGHKPKGNPEWSIRARPGDTTPICVSIYNTVRGRRFAHVAASRAEVLQEAERREAGNSAMVLMFE